MLRKRIVPGKGWFKKTVYNAVGPGRRNLEVPGSLGVGGEQGGNPELSRRHRFGKSWQSRSICVIPRASKKDLALAIISLAELMGMELKGAIPAPCTKKEDGKRCAASEKPGGCVPSPRSPALL